MTKKDNLLQSPVLATVTPRKSVCGIPSEIKPQKSTTPAWLKNLMRLYGSLLGEQLSSRSALRILHAQMALLMLLFPFTLGFMVRLLLLLWFVVALLQCRRDD